MDKLNYLNLGVLINHPVNCLNRDDLGEIKRIQLGGVSRQRYSSQCLKRAIREAMQKQYGLPIRASQKLMVSKEDNANGETKGEAKKGNKKAKKPVIIPLSPDEIARCEETDGLPGTINPTFDIAAFGRFVADADSKMTVESAISFAHTISVHEVPIDADYFTAANADGDEGAGHLGQTSFGGGTYCRACSINLRQLKANYQHKDWLEHLRLFIRLFCEVTPSGKRTGMAADTMPEAVVGVRCGQPLTLAGVFGEPVPLHVQNITQESIDRLQRHIEDYATIWECLDLANCWMVLASAHKANGTIQQCNNISTLCDNLLQGV